MRNLLVAFLTLMSVLTFAQSKGKISGVVKDKDMGLEPLAFVSVYVQGNTSLGTTTDFDGNYVLPLNPGKHTIVFDFVGYKPVKKMVSIVAGKTQKVDVIMENLADALETIVLTVKTNKESETALIAEQKEAVEIIESIGAEQLSNQGVSNAAAATEKITGVSKSKSSGDIYIRGLGDRYLSTTLNGLPIASDDIEKKNINLSLFPTSIIQSVGIGKTYSASSYADQTSGHVDILTSVYKKSSEKFKFSFGTGINSNVADKFSSFRVSENLSNINSLGVFSTKIGAKKSSQTQGWNPSSLSTPINYSFSLSKGFKIDSKIGDFSVFTSLSNKRSFSYRQGLFKKYDANFRSESYTDTELFKLNSTTTALVNIDFDLNSSNKFQLVNLFINKLSDNLFEQGRNGEGFKLDNQPRADVGSFIRDQNTKQTRIYIHQLLGTHDLSTNNTLKWALGTTFLEADEPNRIRNEFVIGNGGVETDFTNNGIIAPSVNNKFQQRKSTQRIDDVEVNGFIKDNYISVDEESKQLVFDFGTDVRYRKRDFISQFAGVDVKENKLVSLDNFSTLVNLTNFRNGTVASRNRLPDTYNAQLFYAGVFAKSKFKFNKTTINLGLRFEMDKIEVTEFDVANYFNPVTSIPRIGSTSDTYQNFLPQINIKQQINDDSSVRLSLSKTITLPEFKELAPFQYVTPTNRTIVGNPDLKPSTNYNADLKWEQFFSDDELISFTGFYKNIQNPINFAIQRGAAGNFTYANTGEEATVLGLEAEARFNIFSTENSKLRFTGNFTYMNHNQDLLTVYQYANVKESDLAGASDFILNGGLNYKFDFEKPLNVNLSANYFSDKIFALGAPKNQTNRGTLYNDQIIEKGFVTLDLTFSKKFNDHFSIKASAKNILNPFVDQTQNVLDLDDETTVTKEVVSRYKNGVDYGVSLSYKF